MSQRPIKPATLDRLHRQAQASMPQRPLKGDAISRRIDKGVTPVTGPVVPLRKISKLDPK